MNLPRAEFSTSGGPRTPEQELGEEILAQIRRSRQVLPLMRVKAWEVRQRLQPTTEAQLRFSWKSFKNAHHSGNPDLLAAAWQVLLRDLEDFLNQ